MNIVLKLLFSKIKRIFPNKKSTSSTVAYMSATSFLNSAISIPAGLLVARWMLPEELGTFSGFTIITSYIILVQLGIPSGLSRQLPYYIGLGDKEKAVKYASVSQYYQFLLGIVILVSSILISLFFLYKKEYSYAAGIFVIGFTSFETLYVTKYLKILYRSNNDFNKLSHIRLILTIVTAISVVFVWLFGFYGLCLRAFIMFIVDFYFTWKWRPINVRISWNKDIFKDLMKTGFPIYWVANIFSLWPTIERTIIIALLGSKALGLYSLSLMVLNSMNIISKNFANVLFPKMTTAWGKGISISNLIKIPHKMVKVILILNICIATLAWFIIPPFVHFFLPNYVEAITTTQWILIPGAIAVLDVYGNVYMVIRRNMDRLVSYVIGFLVWITSIILLSQTGNLRLSYFPISLLLGYLTIYIVNYLQFRKLAKLNEKTCIKL